MTLELSLSEANTVAKALKWIDGHGDAVDNSIHATAEEREVAIEDQRHARAILERMS